MQSFLGGGNRMDINRPEHEISIKEINNEIFITDEKVTNGDINNYKLANKSLRNNPKFVEDFGLMALIKFVLAVFKIVKLEAKIDS